jgi:hypothetical protein
VHCGSARSHEIEDFLESVLEFNRVDQLLHWRVIGEKLGHSGAFDFAADLYPTQVREECG